jgi:glycine/D-amino acid oxidase-like deaminating enzyme
VFADLDIGVLQNSTSTLRKRHAVIEMTPATGVSPPIIRLGKRRVRTTGTRSLWLQQELGGSEPYEYQHFEGHQQTDVCIIGGGFTGLWTALEIKRIAPGTEVTLVEADICGSGASGRNGGFALTWWAHFTQLLRLCGPREAVMLCQRAERAVIQIGEFTVAHGIPEAFQMSGWVWAATNADQVGDWEQTLDLLEQFGQTPYQRLSREAIATLAGSQQHLDGVFEPISASIQPAKLARALARAARDAGVHIYEHSQVASIHYGPHTSVVLERGSITTDQVVLAVNAWAAQIPEIGAGLMVVASDVIATEPVPDRLAAIGMDRGVCISDSRRLVHYYRPTLDGRLVFGKGGGALAYNNQITSKFDHPGRRTTMLRSQLIRTYPTLWDVPIAEAWSGPIDYSLSGLPFFVRLRAAPSVLVCAGFSGDGVGPSRLAGEVLAEMATGTGDGGLPKALRTVPTAQLPPEPVRYLGGHLVYGAIVRKERSADLNLKPKRLDSFLASLDPTG